jgi:hypothetical protein
MGVTIRTEGRGVAPTWAVHQRDLINRMDRAATRFVEHATRPDGSLIQRTVWTSMDGPDNGYEAFLSFPLFYLVGGGEHIHELARKEFDAITRQYAEYGTVDREFVTGFDWFHHSESYTYVYYLAMCDPHRHLDRSRDLRYAAMYMGEDTLAPNWDAEHRIIRSPLNGSHGPRFVTTTTDWDYHRPILANYLAPFEDIPGTDSSDPMFKVDWTDDAMFARILEMINARMTRGDVPLNLSATSLVTNAYLHTGESKYRDWVLDYLQTWMERRDRNGGLMPDNVGPSGQIGELMNDKWWGGYYGWRWPHGARNIVEPALVAGSCALLMTGDCSWLDLARSQLDRLWDERREVDGVPMVPARHGDQGWFDFRRPDPYLYIHLSYLSQQTEDRDRLQTVFPDRSGFVEWPQDWGAGKAGICPPKPWSLFVEGGNDSYVSGALESTARSIHLALDRLDADDSDPETRECYHFQPMNPVVPEALVQMTMGTPAAIYNGGLLQTHLRYFDPERVRPGLPQDVAALVSSVSADEARVELVNLDPVRSREVIIQAGSFGEHEFTRIATGDGQQPVDVDASSFTLHLGAGSAQSLHLGLRRFARPPSHALPAELRS